MVAPSLIPMKAGDRVKTDRRDALMLARLHRAGELTPIWIPDAAHEAMRDLVRARATAVRALSKARQHLQGFLLRHDQICHGARAWTLAYRLVAEVGDFRRFTNARQLMAYLGLVPSEHSSGSTVRRAGITKAGNALARRVLIEGAWTYRMSARVSSETSRSSRATVRGDQGHRLESAGPARWFTTVHFDHPAQQIVLQD